jgi:hypothetical protein
MLKLLHVKFDTVEGMFLSADHLLRMPNGVRSAITASVWVTYGDM